MPNISKRKNFFKSSDAKFVYTYIPKKALDVVLEEGLFSSKALLDRPDLMKLSLRPPDSVEDWQEQIRKSLKDSFKRPSLLGPSVFFHLPPKNTKLSKKNPLSEKKNSLVLLRISLSQLEKDVPETKLFGMELEPYNKKTPEKLRHRYLSEKEINNYLDMSPEENWKNYSDPENVGYYASDVPHAAIHLPTGIVPGKYLTQVRKEK